MFEHKSRQLFIILIIMISISAYTFLNSNPLPTTSASTIKVENKNEHRPNVLPDVQIFNYVVNKVKEVVYL